MSPHFASGSPAACVFFLWWRCAESNRWPPACKAGALPSELHPRLHLSSLSFAPFSSDSPTSNKPIFDTCRNASASSQVLMSYSFVELTRFFSLSSLAHLASAHTVRLRRLCVLKCKHFFILGGSDSLCSLPDGLALLLYIKN